MHHLSSICLKNREDKRIQAGHLWIFSNEIDSQKNSLTRFKPGELVYIENNRGAKLGVGYVNPHTLLAARLLTRNTHQIIDTQFFEDKFRTASKLRQLCYHAPYYRLIFGESDELPGLIVDRYHDIFVVQLNTAGMESLKSYILDALVNIFAPRGILLKNDSSIRKLEQMENYVAVGYGEVPDEIEIVENDLRFMVPLKTGQKTGWFFDHRENRKKLISYVAGKRVLDVFSYLGAWGIQALFHQAEKVTFIDSSESALAYVSKNIQLNGLNSTETQLIRGDAFRCLAELISQNESFDVIVLDPPAFVKKRRDLPVGQAAYLQLNELAMKLLTPQGVLFSASCSMLMSEEDLLNMIRKAGLSLGQSIRIIGHLHQAPDHPVHPAIEETEYLKGYIAVRV